MSNKNKVPLVPKLRFPGFKESWSNDSISKVLIEHKLKNTAGRHVFSVSMESGIVNQIEHLGRSYAAADTSNYTVARRFDVVYTKSPLKAFPFGIVKQCKFDGEVALSPLYGVFTPVNQHVGLMIEAYFESTNRSMSFLSPLCQKGAKNTLQITNTTFLSGRIPLPREPLEQQKIADCLCSLDELIAAQARKAHALKTYKKGLMQQLFPREGEAQPRLRFPEFRDTEDWGKSQLNRLTTKISDGIHTTPVYDENGEYAFINGNNLVNGRVLVDEKTKRVGLYEFNKHRKPLSGNTILMSINGTIGNLALFRNEQVVLGKSACFINVDIDLADSVFIYYLIQTDSVQSVFNAELTGSTIKNLSLGTIKNAAVSIPRLPEQQRIASFLFALDDLITGNTKELETLKTHKKGLMQQLFPSAEAVEG